MSADLVTVGETMVLLHAPEVGPLPALESGRVTFGCFNNLAKVTPEVLRSWARILAALPGALRRARALLDLVPPRDGEGVLTTSSTGLAGLLLSEVDTARVAGFADRRLGPLRDHDTLRGTDLVGTLRSYLRHDRSTAATAADLYVHPNTVALRVRRIEALLDVDLGRVEDLTDLRAALLIDEVGRPSTA